MKKHAPYGSWLSPISADMVAGKTPKISETQLCGKRIFWCESLPDEKGRVAIMMQDDSGSQCILPRPLSAKSKVHEYGGGAYCVNENTLYFVLADDQCIYRAEIGQADFVPERLSPKGNFRFADLIVDTFANRLIAVCEDHNSPLGADAQEPRNSIVVISLADSPELDGSDAAQRMCTLTQGQDFYSNPQLSNDGSQLCWLSWNHPAMPWDNTQLWLADISAAGLSHIRQVAGNGEESIFQPQWAAEGELFYVSDCANWWNIYSLSAHELMQGKPQSRAIYSFDAEFATPQWTFGMSTYGFVDDNTIVATYTRDGQWHLVRINTDKRTNSDIYPIQTDCSYIESVRCAGGRTVYIGASASASANIYVFDRIDGSDRYALYPKKQVVDSEEFSRPQAMKFPSSEGQSARVLFYPPHNKYFCGETGLPPVIVICHGGPTGASESSLNLKIQYWTNRGFAVADVNYRGSTGYGREFRRRLYGKWGEYDVDDVCAVVGYLERKKLVDARRCVIKGSSAGGYTVLATLAFRDTFSAGVSLYGIGDLELLAKDTHKFEARYMDTLVGPYPEQKALYQQRSPIHFVDNINCPLLVFQGLQDKVVPPNQAQAMVDATKTKGLPVAYVTYPDEAHGFRDGNTITHMLESEWLFYAAIFGFNIGDPIHHTLTIHNLKDSN
ncbi:MAG: dipeptidyl aminopeptidase/acylaminoacyl peptidase [Lentisphaeria bacterium]|jgi:dipeptidyl aminopeptidase/acylaminoacyl peptidase